MTDLYWDPIESSLRDDPYPLWKRLRDEAPVWHNDRYDFYVLSRFHDIEAAHKDPLGYSSAHGTTIETLGPDVIETSMMIWTDPPKHSVLRKLVSRAFTIRRVGEIEERIRSIAAGMLDPHLGSGGFDYVQEFAANLPPTVISTMLGVPFPSRKDTSASPFPSSVMTCAVSSFGLGRKVSAAARTAFWSRGVKARSACCTRLPSWARTSSGTSSGFCVTK